MKGWAKSLPVVEVEPRWRQEALGNVIELISGQHIDAKDYNSIGRGLPYLTGPSDFGETNPRISRWTEHPKKSAKRGDILLTVKGSGVGKTNILNIDEAVISRQIMAVRAKNIDPNYLALIMQASQKYFLGLASGAAIPGISRGDVTSLNVTLPPRDEQKRIVAVLDQTFAALDRARAHAEANLTDAAALLLNWVGAVFAAGKDTWPERGLVDICENLDRLRVPITKSDREAGSIPYYGASGVVDHVATHIFDEDLLLVSEDGANLLARTYPIAFSITGKAWVNNHAHVLRFEDLDTQEFVRLYLNSISLEPFVSGMAQPKLNQKALNNIPLPFPDMAEQRKIVGQAREIGEASERARISYELKLTDLANLRQSLLQKAFSGELT